VLEVNDGRSPRRRADARLTVPAALRGLVARERLFRMVDAGTTVPLTLVCAPAGSGKTVLVSSWAASRPGGPPAWVSLDEDDLGDGSIWPLAAEALARHGVGPVAVPHDGGRAFLVALGGALCPLEEPVVLVLDCETSLPPDVAGGLEVLLRSSGGQLRLVLLTRVDPLLPLHRYRLDGSIFEIRSAELRFTDQEADALLRRSGLELSGAARARVMERTRGWAAGLRFTALLLSSAEDSESAALTVSGDHGSVSEYLLAEVLDRQPGSTRNLLLRTSVVDVLVPGLAEALAGPSASRDLAALARADVFLEPVGPGCYRYHPLFRELLRAQLGYEGPADEARLHLRAARWLATHGAVVAAVRQAAAASSWDDACRYVVDCLAVGRLLAEGAGGGLHHALADLPPEARGREAALVRSALAGPAPERVSLAATADDGWSVGAQLAGLLLRLRDETSAGDVRAALATVEGGQRLVARLGIEHTHPEVLALLARGRGAALLHAGRVDDAVEAFRDSAFRAGPGAEPLASDSLGHLALVAAGRGELRRATRLAQQSLELSAHAPWAAGEGVRAAEVALAWVSTEMGDFSDARVHAVRARTDGASTGPLPAVMLAVATARVACARGDLAGAQAVLAAAGRELRLPRWMQEFLRAERDERDERAERAAAETVGGEPVRAVVPAATGDRVPTERVSLAALVDGGLVDVVAMAREGDDEGARRRLEEVLRLAAPQLMRRPFYDAPPEVRRLMREDRALAGRHRWLVREAVQQPPRPGTRTSRGGSTSPARTHPPRQAAPSGTGHGPGGAGGPGAADAAHPGTAASSETSRALVPVPGLSSTTFLVEPLTAKELEVLTHLGALLTTEEIAQTMFISVNTVRTHVRNVLRKLAVSRRYEAVRKARSLQLIPS